MPTKQARANKGVNHNGVPTRDKGGRPSSYSDRVGELICARIADGETLSAIMRTPGMPHRTTFYRWLRENSGFAEEYERARHIQMQTWADEIISISDDSTLDTVTKRDPKGREYEAVDHENIQRDRLRVDTRKFLMGKIAPRMFGDRVTHEHTGEVGHRVEIDDRERVRRLALFLLEGQATGDTFEGESIQHPDNAGPEPHIDEPAIDDDL